MPEVPIFVAEPRGPMLFMPRVPEAGAHALGASLQQMGETWRALADRVQQQQNQLDAASRIGQWNLRMAEEYESILADQSLRKPTVHETLAARAQALQDAGRRIRRELWEGATEPVKQAMLAYETQHGAALTIRLRADTLQREVARQQTEFATLLREQARLAAQDPERESSFFETMHQQLEMAREQEVLPEAFLTHLQQTIPDLYWRQVALTRPERVQTILQRLAAGEAPPSTMPTEHVQTYAQLSSLSLRALLLEQQQREAEARRLQAEEQEQVRRSFVAKWHEGKLTPKDVLASPLPANEQEHYLKLIRASLEPQEKFVRDPSVLGEVFAGITTGKVTSVTQINDAFIRSQQMGRGINKDDYTFLVRMLTDAQSPDGRSLQREIEQALDIAKSNLVKSILGGPTDPVGMRNFHAYRDWLFARVQQMREQGKDPFSLFRKDSPDYVLDVSVLRRYQPTLKEQGEEMTQRLKPQTTTRQPGESIDDYLRRMGKP